MSDMLVVIEPQLDTVPLHRFEMLAPRDQTDLGPGPGEEDPHIAADRARPVDTDPHRVAFLGLSVRASSLI
jgi:hypothetical protein